MSIGRIELVDGKKQYVRYATLGGSGGGGVSVGNVQNLSLDENTDNLTLKWIDPEDVVFNGETTAEWAGTKVVRKEGSAPASESDGMLITDSTVRDQYAVDGLQDTDVLADTQYNYALFPYTTKNVYTMSDLNRASGTRRNTYDPVLKNNTWADIDKASRDGVAKEWWNVGDEKDGYIILGFDHDDLSDGSGKAGITFFLYDSSKLIKKPYDTRTGYYNYAVSQCQNELNSMFDGLPEEIKKHIKTVNKLYQVTETQNGQLATISQKLFLLTSYEAVGSPANSAAQGAKYEYSGNYPASANTFWNRNANSANTEFATCLRIGTNYSKITTSLYHAYAFCI